MQQPPQLHSEVVPKDHIILEDQRQGLGGRLPARGLQVLDNLPHGIQVRGCAACRPEDPPHALVRAVGPHLGEAETEPARDQTVSVGKVQAPWLTQVHAWDAGESQVEPPEHTIRVLQALDVPVQVNDIHANVVSEPLGCGPGLLQGGSGAEDAQLAVLADVRGAEAGHQLRRGLGCEAPEGSLLLAVSPRQCPNGLVTTNLLNPSPARVLARPVRCKKVARRWVYFLASNLPMRLKVKRNSMPHLPDRDGGIAEGCQLPGSAEVCERLGANSCVQLRTNVSNCAEARQISGVEEDADSRSTE
mmetsp:Transcript_7113/g.21674  ORF Transcript_7113/g.21674 Transcript_7113/m.21674 type:complete len:303 (-) Transcript_7113:278-1186(-)